MKMYEIIERLETRLGKTIQFLKDDYPTISDDQNHLDGGSTERGYWHYGYAMALRDILKLLQSSDTTTNTPKGEVLGAGRDCLGAPGTDVRGSETSTREET